MITLDAVESYFPARTVTVEERARELGRNPAQTHMARRIQGLDRMHHDPGADLYDLVLPPARAVLAGIDPASVRYLLYAHAIHGARGVAIGAPQRIKAELGLEHATAFSLTEQNCAIPLSAIDVAGALLRADGDPGARVLVVTGEKVPKPVAEGITTVLVGDGAACCLVGQDGPGAVVRSFVTRTRGEYYDGLNGTREQFRAAAEERPRILREITEEAVARAGCTLDDIEVIVPPNQGLAFWQGTLDDDLLAKCFFDNNPRYSHCLGADVLINCATLWRERRLPPSGAALLLATGLGWTFSAMVLTPPTRGADAT